MPHHTSMILPVFNGSTLIDRSFASLVKQTIQPDELIIVDDASTDDSYKKLKLLSKQLSYKVKIIRHTVNRGLAQSYNSALMYAKGDIIMTFHQDAVIRETNGLKQLLKPFEDPDVVAAGHKEFIDRVVWQEYPFWLKALTARHIGNVGYGINGKCDAFRKNALLSIGMFDHKTFRTAGEDGDMIFRLRRIGKVVNTDTEVMHIHDHNFTFRDLVYKHAQLAEAQGVHLRRLHIQSFSEFFRIFFREILLLLAVIPYTRPIGIFLVVVYAFFYTEKLYQQEYKNILIVLIPFVNIYLLFVDSFYVLRGFIREKQIL